MAAAARTADGFRALEIFITSYKAAKDLRPPSSSMQLKDGVRFFREYTDKFDPSTATLFESERILAIKPFSPAALSDSAAAISAVAAKLLQLENFSLSTRGMGKGAALIEALSLSCTDLMETLIKAGGSTEVRNEEGNTALICASEQGKGKAAGLLLDNGADIEAVNPKGITALGKVVGAVCGDLDVLKLLLERRAKTEARDAEGYTALLRVVSMGSRADRIAVMTLLLDHGADIKAEVNGQTALQIATELGRDDAKIFLLERGAMA